MCAALCHYEEQTRSKQSEKISPNSCPQNLFLLIFVRPQVHPVTQLHSGDTSQILGLAHKVLIILLDFYLPDLLRNISLLTDLTHNY